MMSVMRMNMAAVSTITLLLLCCCVFDSQGSQDSCEYAETNKDFNVPLSHKLKNTERLKWKFEGNIIFDRVGPSYIEGKAGDVTAEGFLVIKKANKNNNGMYKPEVYDQNGRAVQNLKSIKLCVIDPPPTPTVKMDCPEPGKKVKFTCTFDKVGENLRITWQQNAKVLDKEKDKNYLMLKAETVENDEFRCNVSNPVGQKSSLPVKQECYTSGFVFPEELWGINTWILVGIGGGVVVLLIIIIIVCCVCNRRKRRMQIKDEEELRLGWTNTQPQHPHQHNHPPHQHQHQHHHHHHHQQQPAGHTGPRQHRSRQQRNHPLPRTPDQANGQPQPSPRRPAQAPTPANNCDEEQPPPLPQPRKKAPKTPRA